MAQLFVPGVSLLPRISTCSLNLCGWSVNVWPSATAITTRMKPFLGIHRASWGCALDVVWMLGSPH